jgi:N-acyl-D-aspartate/D-glutamate deacylase
MLEAIQHYVQLPIPLWLFAWLIVALWFRDRETRRWIMRIAETVDKMDSDEHGWCRHDPVAFVITDPSEAAGKLLNQLMRDKKAK